MDQIIARRKKLVAGRIIYSISLNWQARYNLCHRHWRPATTTHHMLAPYYKFMQTVKILGH
jgi:hypothetical protein